MKGEILSIEIVEKIASLEKRIKELETINEEHRKINGELRETINKAIEYINSIIENIGPDLYNDDLDDLHILLNILQNGEENKQKTIHYVNIENEKEIKKKLKEGKKVIVLDMSDKLENKIYKYAAVLEKDEVVYNQLPPYWIWGSDE